MTSEGQTVRQRGRHELASLCIWAAVFLVGCNTDEGSAGATTDIDAINQVREAWSEAYDAGDVDAFVSHLTPDVVWMPHSGTLTVGKDRVRAGYEQYFSGTTADLTFSPAELEVAGDWAFERGTLTSIRNPGAGGEQLRQDANYIIIWQRTAEGSWKIARAIWVGEYQPVRDG